MNAPTSTPDQDRQNGRVLGLLFTFGFLVCLLAITGQSLWIDEALTAWKAKQPTLSTWWQAMADEKTWDRQMPLYMIYVWTYEKVFGSNEWMLRIANLPWFAMGMFAFITALSSSNQRRFAVALAVSLSPFAWYCLNEARPYAMQLGASLFVFATLHRLGQDQRAGDSSEGFWVVGFFVAMVVLCGSSLLGIIWAVTALGAAALTLPRGWVVELWRRHCVSGVIAGSFILVLGVYYLWTLKVGARAASVAVTDWKNLFFIGYELLGFSGLGPGRLEIREGGLNAFQPHGLKLAFYGVAVLIVIGSAVRRLFEAGDHKKHFVLVLIVTAPAVVLLIAALMMHFRVLGRHFTPMMPVVLFTFVTGVTALWSRGGWLRKLLVCAFFVLSVFSCFSLRFAARHEKDNYRDAALFAREALQSAKQVWWNADGYGAAYYQVPTANEPAAIGKAWWLMNPSRESLSGVPVPDVIIASKPDIFDQKSALAEYAARTGFGKVATLPAFTIWQRSAK